MNASIASLADVELQLVMHGLDASSLLQFARCSHRLMHAADHPFAWRHTRLPVALDKLHAASRRIMYGASIDAPTRSSARLLPKLVAAGWNWLVSFISPSPPLSPSPSLPALDNLAPPAPVSRLLRHVRLSARWTRSGWTLTFVHIDILLSLPLPLYELNASELRFVGLDVWQRILTCPAAQHLRVLRLYGADGFDSGPIAQLPHLHTLAVAHWAPFASDWASLPAAPSLTSLSIVDRYVHTSRQSSCLQSVAQCSKLTHLNVWSNALDGDGFSSFFAGSPYMHLLQSLQLTSFECESVSAVSYAAAFSALVSLRSLCLHSCTSSHLLLPHLTHAPALRHLTLQSRRADDLRQLLESELVAALAALLSAAPRLHCTRSLQLPSSTLLQQLANLAGAKQRTESNAQLRPFGERFRVEFIAMP